MQKRKNYHNFFSRNQLRRIRKKLIGRITNLNYPTLFLALGLFFFAIWGLRELHLATRLSFNSTVNEATIQGNIIYPKKILIPSLSINLPVEETLIENGIWEIGKTGASHLSTSGYPGNKGNIIIYGHNTDNRLGRLNKIKKGDTINLISKNDKLFGYKVRSIEIVNPTDIEKLTAYNDETLTIYTCTGFADLKRLLIKADRV